MDDELRFDIAGQNRTALIFLTFRRREQDARSEVTVSLPGAWHPSTSLRMTQAAEAFG
jgi:hypothetical protein